MTSNPSAENGIVGSFAGEVSSILEAIQTCNFVCSTSYHQKICGMNYIDTNLDQADYEVDPTVDLLEHLQLAFDDHEAEASRRGRAVECRLDCVQLATRQLA